MTARHRRADDPAREPAEISNPSTVFSVLFVCTANVVRSPLAERLLLARLLTVPGSTSSEIVASSAGTHAAVGCPMDPLAGLALRELGGNPNGHAARQLEPGLLRGASLILTATTSQRDAITRAERSVLLRTFTMREFARLSAELPPRRPGPVGTRLVNRVRDVAERRAHTRVPSPSRDEIADPLGGALEVHRFRAAQISAAIDGLIYSLELRAATARPARGHGLPAVH